MMARTQSMDTTPGPDAVQFELLRRMTPEEKAALFTSLTLAVQDLAMAGMRERYPTESEHQLRLRLAEQRLGEETVRRIWRSHP